LSTADVPLRWTDHRVFPAAGGALLFDAEQASLFALDEQACDVLARWRDRAPLSLDDVPGEDRDVLAALAGLQVLRPVQARPPSAPRPDPASIPLGTLVLEAAQACNLRCTYCYAGGGSYGGPARVMEPALAARAARTLVEASGDRPTVTLVLFGGEPLLNLPALTAAVEAAQAAAAEHGKRLVLSMTTNGTRFTDAALDFIAAHDIGVSVSIDGPPDLHDANRRFAGGGGSYADVVAGVAKLVARTGRAPAARVTLTPPQWSRVPEVFDHLAALGFVEVGIAPTSPVSADFLPTPAQDEALMAGFAALARRFADAAADGRVLPFSNLLDLLAKLHAGDVRLVPCGAGLGYVAMDAQGAYYPCHRFAGDAAFRIGDVAAGRDHAKVRTYLDNEARARAPHCASCWARSLCAGGCHYDNHQREVVLRQPRGGSCDFIRRWTALGLSVYAELRGLGGPVLAFLDRRAGFDYEGSRR
jgi:uncharacterized protein